MPTPYFLCLPGKIRACSSLNRFHLVVYIIKNSWHENRIIRVGFNEFSIELYGKLF